MLRLFTAIAIPEDAPAGPGQQHAKMVQPHLAMWWRGVGLTALYLFTVQVKHEAHCRQYQ